MTKGSKSCGAPCAAVLALALCMALPAVGAAAWAEAGPFEGLNAAQYSALAAGETVIRSVPSASRLAISADRPAAAALRSRIAALRPNYLTEVMAYAPASSDGAASALLERLAAALADVQGYVGIPYWSKQQKKTYDLFDKMAVKDRASVAGGQTILVDEHMEPFDGFGARYEYRLVDSMGAAATPGRAAALAFAGSNTGPIVYSYRNFRAVEPGGMSWELYAFYDKGTIYFYGVGAVRAFDLLGIFRGRLEASFMGRVAAFFSEMNKRMRR
jgi:hypothetical protein